MHNLIPIYSARGTDEEGQLYGFTLASGKRMWEQRKNFSQHLANTKTKFDEIIGDEASLMCSKVLFATLSPKLAGWALLVIALQLT